MSLPDFTKSNFKTLARAENIKLFREFSGRSKIPNGRQYWTLCNFQPPSVGSEIVQLLNSKFVKPEQFHGVDRDSSIIAENKKWHPDANWHSAEWNDIIDSYPDFNPSLIYLDTTNFADHRIGMKTVTRTMMACGPETLLLANLMANDVRSQKQFDLDSFCFHVEKNVPPQELLKWSSEVKNYIYSSTGRAFMVTYALWKKK